MDHRLDQVLEQRAAVHAALGEPVRLAIVEELAVSDRAPSVLSARFGLPGNLLAHHLEVLKQVGLIERHVSAGDRRRRYVQLRRRVLDEVGVGTGRRRDGWALFVCTQNSARSQLAAALWRRRTGARATSAGTHLAKRYIRARLRLPAGLDLGRARPRALTRRMLPPPPAC
jgi:ArsR family transcriptional regulator, arsenate/arsenite/antimonite-responsive transcriptional repressor / arsenate reductase (thioredoxin)